MTEVFVIRNQLGHYWGKSKTWLDGSEARAVMRAKHRDEAVNTLVELSSKDFELRGDVVTAELTERGEPIIESSQIPLPITAEPEPAECEIAQPDTAEAEQAVAETQATSDDPLLSKA